MLPGLHVSIRRGYLAAARTAKAMGADSFQYFPKNPRSLAVKTFDERDARACAAFCRENGLVSIAHAPYPLNIANCRPEARSAQILSLLNDLAIAEACGSIGVVVHFGKYRGRDPLQAYKNSIQCLDEVLARWQGRAKILLENLAGEGTDIGMTFEECAQLRRLSQYPDKIGFCLDTCHLFASGIWNGENEEEVAERGAKSGYTEGLIAIHLNDSLFPSGSRRDRHAPPGGGRIGLTRIGRLLRRFERRDIPAVMETTPTDGAAPDALIGALKELLLPDGCTTDGT
jgi:deoxyribonuclease-4